jgi:DNA replication protein DnaC
LERNLSQYCISGMDIDKIITTITNQIPLIIMTISNGTSIYNLIPLLLIPILIYFIQSVPQFVKYTQKEKIPKHYVCCQLEDGGMFRNPDFIENLSIFLNFFHPTSIKTGQIKKYYWQSDNPILPFKCYHAIINPDSKYYCKFFLGKDIILGIKKIGFFFPKGMNLDNLQKDPIYIWFDSITEQVKEAGIEKKVQKDLVKISASSMKIIEDFVYVVNNYSVYKNNNINNFKLTKTIYYYDQKEDSKNIDSTVNVIKNYNNVFLSKKNYQMIVDTIIEWENNKLEQLSKGIPNKLSFFLVGTPGCGKSSLIFAIANETKKHIVSVNLQDFTNKAFISLMSTIENKVVVFDDIDTHKFTHKRIQIEVKEDTNQMEQIKLALIASKDDKDGYVSKFNKVMTLDVFLEVLDGYNYLNNCIVILTSNHPELLDPAVTRPGRIDHIIEFDLCDKYQFENIFKYFVGSDYRKIDPKYKFQEKCYSTSYIINTIILPNKNNPRKILDLLK